MTLAANGGMRILWLVCSFAFVLSWSPRAHACGIAPNAYWTFESLEPADGASDVPLDAVIGLRLKEWAGDGQGESKAELHLFLAQSGEPVAATRDDADQTSSVSVWKPSALLQPNTQYRVEVRITSTNLPATVQGSDKASVTFTTSARQSSPLRLEGSLHVQLHQGTVPVMDCGICGSCQQNGERRAVVADVDAPRVSGGFDLLGYEAWLTLTDRSAPTFNGPGEGKLEGEHSLNLPHYLSPQPGAANALTVEIPREDPNTDVCFGWNAWDAAGHWQSAAPVCFKAAELDAQFAQLDASAAAGSQAPATPDAGPASSSHVDEDGGTAASNAKPADAGASRDSSAPESSDAGAAVTDEPAPVHVKACTVAAVGGRSDAGTASALAVLAAASSWFRRRRLRARLT